MKLDFAKITGPYQSSRENFEELVSQLLSLELGAQPIHGAGGDEGIDCFCQDNEYGLHVFQAKYFLGRLTTSQRTQISESLKRVCTLHPVTRWTLCIPLNATLRDLRWFRSIKPETVTIQWWGTTKLRALLAKHNFLAQQFFAEDELARRFAEFQNEISRRLAILERSRPTRGGEQSATTEPHAYLVRAERIANLLTQDAALLSSAESVIIAIDFYDLYCYLTGRDDLRSSWPVIESCIDSSPFPLLVLPPHAFELAEFIKRLPRLQRQPEEAVTGANELAAFRTAYRDNPSSDETRRAFSAVNRSYGTAPLVIASAAMPKLKEALTAGRISFVNDSARARELGLDSSIQGEERDEIDKTSRLFRSMRRDRSLASYCDSVAVSLLRRGWRQAPNSIRMISSSPSVARVARAVFGEGTPVRSAADFAYFLQARQWGRGGQPGEMEMDAEALRWASVSLRPFVGSRMDRLAPRRRELALAAFAAFAPPYRNVLRPVDELILRGGGTTSRLRDATMRELYDFLSQEASVVDGFRRWWEHMQEVIESIRSSLTRRALPAVTGEVDEPAGEEPNG